MTSWPLLSLRIHTYWCLVGNGWEWGNGMIITSDYGSFPHSLLSTSKHMNSEKIVWLWDEYSKWSSKWRIGITHLSSLQNRGSLMIGSGLIQHLRDYHNPFWDYHPLYWGLYGIILSCWLYYTIHIWDFLLTKQFFKRLTCHVAHIVESYKRPLILCHLKWSHYKCKNT